MVAVLPNMSSCCTEEERQAPTRTGQNLTPTTAAEVIEDMTDYIQAHQELSFEAHITYEVVQESGQKLQFDQEYSLVASRPDRLFWTTWHDDGSADSAWYEDGTFTMLKQPDNIYGQIEVPGTITEMIGVVVDEYGIAVPFMDILAGQARETIQDAAPSGWYVGASWVNGAWTHHVALRAPDVDIEIWVGMDEPVPSKLTITWKHEVGMPSYMARFGKWNTSPSIQESVFHFEAPPDAELVEIVPEAEPTEGGV
jgi:hypothetical protein